ncbi:putative quinol monooxygenase [Mariniluteicoccus flavus]
MIAITVKWDVKPEYADDFLELTREFTEACRAEPGCLWFEWSRSCENPNEYVLIEAYRDARAGAEHVQSGHFAEAMRTQGQYAASRPKVISVEAPGDGWSELGEIEMPDHAG